MEGCGKEVVATIGAEFRVRKWSNTSGTLPDLIGAGAPTLRKSRRVGQPKVVMTLASKAEGGPAPYLDEQMFRYNHRKDENGRKLTDGERFTLALSQIAGKRLTFAEVTGKVGETPF